MTMIRFLQYTAAYGEGSYPAAPPGVRKGNKRTPFFLKSHTQPMIKLLSLRDTIDNDLFPPFWKATSWTFFVVVLPKDSGIRSVQVTSDPSTRRRSKRRWKFRSSAKCEGLSQANHRPSLHCGLKLRLIRKNFAHAQRVEVELWKNKNTWPHDCYR